MRKLKEYGSHYKVMCRKAIWEDSNEHLSETLTVDADSVIFDEIRRFVGEIPTVDIREKMMAHARNVFDRKSLIGDYVILLAGRCSDRIRSLPDGEVVFGKPEYPKIKEGTRIERERNRKRTLSALANNVSLYDTAQILRSIKLLGEHLLTLRDRIRDETSKNFPHATFSEEPDKYCARRYPLSFSYDYDLYLFGLQEMAREVNGSRQFLSSISLRQQLGLSDMKEFIIACILQGTDYNKGYVGMGPVRSTKQAKKGFPDDVTDEMKDVYEYLSK
jgi:hypothetical protein